ncbi:MAG: CPBP family intramembrane glutamic endopeptidase [Elusimicrobiota bacterium]|jgi:membrane protease YdiL (CAAX protease family)
MNTRSISRSRTPAGFGRGLLSVLCGALIACSQSAPAFAQAVASIANTPAPITGVCAVIPGLNLRDTLSLPSSIVSGEQLRVPAALGETGGGIKTQASIPFTAADEVSTVVAVKQAAPVFSLKKALAFSIQKVFPVSAKAEGGIARSLIRSLARTEQALAVDPLQAPQVLSGVYDNSAAAKTEDSEVVPVAASVSAQSSLSKLRAAYKGGKDSATVPEPSTPAKKIFAKLLSKPVLLGLAVAAIQIILEAAGFHIAGAAGLTPSYSRPQSGADVPLPAAIIIGFLQSALIKPAIEELMRMGAMEGLFRVFSAAHLGKAAVWLSAGISSLAFVLLHETSPLFLAIRLAGALLQAYAYMETGLPGAIAAHAFHNGFYYLQASADALSPGAGLLASILFWIASAVYASKTLKTSQEK